MKYRSDTAIFELMFILVILFVLVQLVGCGPEHTTYSVALAPISIPNPGIGPNFPPNVVKGLSCRLYDLSGLQPSVLPNFNPTPSQTIQNNQPTVTSSDFLLSFLMTEPIDFVTPQQVLGQAPGYWGMLPTTWFGLDCTGLMDVQAETGYAFQLTSDDGSQLLIDGLSVVLNNGLHSAATVSGEIVLPPGTHPVELQYFQGPGASVLELFSNQPVSFHQ